MGKRFFRVLFTKLEKIITFILPDGKTEGGVRDFSAIPGYGCPNPLPHETNSRTIPSRRRRAVGRHAGRGFINDTYIVTTERARYVLQRKNRNVFTDIPAMMRNIEGVTSFLREKVRRAGGDPRREVMTVTPRTTERSITRMRRATIGPRRSSSRIR